MKTEMKKGVKAPIDGTSAGWVVRNNKPWISYDLEDTAVPAGPQALAGRHPLHHQHPAVP